MTERVEFEMTEEDCAELLKHMQPVPWFAPGGVWPKTPQENANDAWDRLGQKMGFVGSSVQAVAGKGQRFFTANAI